MEVSVTNQAYIFLSSVVGGLLVGFLFDIFRIMRRVVKTANFITYLQDILFWILVTVIIFALVFVTNSGELRWYEFLGVCLGTLFYNLLFSTYVIKVSVSVISFIKMVIAFIVKVLLFPILLIYKLLRRPSRFLLRQGGKGCRKVGRMAKKSGSGVVSALKKAKTRLKKI